MFFTEEDKIFYGSFMAALDRTKILGYEDLSHLLLFESLAKILKYAEAQANAGVEGYDQKVYLIKQKINKLKKCDKICNYKERLLLSYSCVNPT
jgi:D-alanyl-D-alanine dipeptidase